jgi:hypothetical protein
MSFTQNAFEIFNRSIEDYHIKNNIDQGISNPFEVGSIDNILYKKNWIDTVQWHLEDEIRRPEIADKDGMLLKRRIDKSNQDRTDLVEDLDTWFLKKYADVKIQSAATYNTESPAWAFDRLSILALKIYHMHAETTDASKDAEHHAKCEQKLTVLHTQKADLIAAIEELLENIRQGKMYMKVYKQMKMYNDPSMNPALQNK